MTEQPPQPARPANFPQEHTRPPMTGSEVRDHLANERTYLAWLRTGMALLGLGFVVARLRIELGQLAPSPAGPGWLRGITIGLGFAGLAVATVLFATWRYLVVRRMIETQRFVPLGASLVALSTGALAIAIMVILYLLHQLVR
jgi:inner membrane protein YidH